MNANLPILKSLKTTVIRSKDTWATAIGVEPKTPVIDYFDTVNTTVLDDIATELNAQCGSIGAAVKVIATIPAKNEQESIYECLESFSKQRNLYGQKLDEFLYHIIVLCHDCTDSTIEECERFALEYPDVGLSVLSISHPSVNNVGQNFTTY